MPNSSLKVWEMFGLHDDVFYLKAKNQPAKATILFIHGFTSTYLLHHLFVLKNEFDDYNYLTMNLKGHMFDDSYSEKSFKELFKNKEVLKEYDLQAYVAELEAYIESHKLYKLIIIGHSMGGGIALMLQEKIKKRVLKLILVDAINPAIYGSKIGCQYLRDTIRNRFMPLKKIEFEKHIVEDDDPKLAEVMNEYVNYEIERFLKNKRKFLFIGAKLINPSLYIKLNNIYKNLDIPTLYIMGKKDKVIPYSYSRKYFQKINNPYIIFKTVDNAGHVPFVEQFQEYNHYVWWFIKSKLFY